MARPSPYPSPVQNGQLEVCFCPIILKAYGVAHVFIPGIASESPEKKRTNASDDSSPSHNPISSSTFFEWMIKAGCFKGVGFTLTKCPDFTRRDVLFGALASVSGSGFNFSTHEWFIMDSNLSSTVSLAPGFPVALVIVFCWSSSCSCTCRRE